ncbi:hypothetical protein V1477_017693 [Vespula maculifrons]|uniref:Uncharacterized protein n=1 Tax=Vespula maculifrons TaxID=7453 RepID=A0ABD2B6S9_VESMC
MPWKCAMRPLGGSVAMGGLEWLRHGCVRVRKAVARNVCKCPTRVNVFEYEVRKIKDRKDTPIVSCRVQGVEETSYENRNRRKFQFELPKSSRDTPKEDVALLAVITTGRPPRFSFFILCETLGRFSRQNYEHNIDVRWDGYSRCSYVETDFAFALRRSHSRSSRMVD